MRITSIYRKLEHLGTNVLGLFVLQVEASAAACGRRYFSSCWQCSYGPCDAYCCPLEGCCCVRCHV